MAKYSLKKLTKEKQQKLLLELCQALSVVKDIKEAAHLLGDLLSPQEIEMIAKRLQIAKLLIKGLTYNDIDKELTVSPTTISRVNAWLQQSGEGYRIVIERSKNNKELKDLTLLDQEKINTDYDKMSWEGVKRRYPSYFWPQLLLEEVLNSASSRQKKKLKDVLGVVARADKKNDLYKRLNIILKNKNIK